MAEDDFRPRLLSEEDEDALVHMLATAGWHVFVQQILRDTLTTAYARLLKVFATAPEHTNLAARIEVLRALIDQTYECARADGIPAWVEAIFWKAE